MVVTFLIGGDPISNAFYKDRDKSDHENILCLKSLDMKINKTINVYICVFLCICIHTILYIDSPYSIKAEKSPSNFSQIGSALKKTAE